MIRKIGHHLVDVSLSRLCMRYSKQGLPNPPYILPKSYLSPIIYFLPKLVSTRGLSSNAPSLPRVPTLRCDGNLHSYRNRLLIKTFSKSMISQPRQSFQRPFTLCSRTLILTDFHRILMISALLHGSHKARGHGWASCAFGKAT